MGREINKAKCFLMWPRGELDLTNSETRKGISQYLPSLFVGITAFIFRGVWHEILLEKSKNMLHSMADLDTI